MPVASDIRSCKYVSYSNPTWTTSISPIDQSPGGRVSRPRSPRTRRRRGGGPWWTRGWSSGPRTPPPGTWAAGSHKPCLSNLRERGLSRFLAMQGFATDWNWGRYYVRLPVQWRPAGTEAGDLTGQRLVSCLRGQDGVWWCHLVSDKLASTAQTPQQQLCLDK